MTSSTSKELLEILKMSQEGKTVRQIAAAMNIGKSTVQRRLEEARSKGITDSKPKIDPVAKKEEVDNTADDYAATSESESKAPQSVEGTVEKLYDVMGIPLSSKETALVKRVIEMVKDLPVCPGTNSNEAYYLCYELKDTQAELSVAADPEGWNMEIGTLEKLKMIHPVRIKDRYKKVRKVVSYNDYLVYLTTGQTVIVARFYMDHEHFPNYDVSVLSDEERRNVEEALKFAKMIQDLPLSSDSMKSTSNERVSATGNEDGSEDSTNTSILQQNRAAGYEWGKKNSICVNGVLEYDAGDAFYEQNIFFDRGGEDRNEFWHGVVDYVSERQKTKFDIEFFGIMVRISESKIPPKAEDNADGPSLW